MEPTYIQDLYSFSNPKGSNKYSKNPLTSKQYTLLLHQDRVNMRKSEIVKHAKTSIG